MFLCRASHCFHLHSLHRLTPDPGRSVSHHSPNTTHIILNFMAHKHAQPLRLSVAFARVVYEDLLVHRIFVLQT